MGAHGVQHPDDPWRLGIAIWDGFRSGFTFWQFFLRIAIMFTVYKVYDMIFFDYFLLCKFRFFQHY